MTPDVHAAAASLEADLVRWRRDFHSHPEPGFGEFRTASRIAAYLEELGYDVRVAEEAMDPQEVLHRDDERIDRAYQRALEAGCERGLLDRMRRGGTAVVADLVNGPGPLVAFRFDMDCLPIVESTDAGHRPHAEGFASKFAGEMHACGHDGHMALGLGVATVLARCRPALGGGVRLVFQPAEEGALGGAAAIAARGAVDDVDYLLAAHLGLGAPSGEIVCAARFLATSKYRVSFTGKPAHVTNSPQRGRNALLAASSAALALHSIAPHGDGWFSVNVGVLRAGDEQGVTPSWATMDLGFWAETGAVHDYIDGRVREILAGSAEAWGVTTDWTLIGKAPTVDPDERLAALVEETARSVPGVDTIRPFATSRAGEDACVLLERVSERGKNGVYVLVGSDLADPHHSSRFDFDEHSLVVGTAMLSRVAVELLRGDEVD